MIIQFFLISSPSLSLPSINMPNVLKRYQKFFLGLHIPSTHCSLFTFKHNIRAELLSLSIYYLHLL